MRQTQIKWFDYFLYLCQLPLSGREHLLIVGYKCIALNGAKQSEMCANGAQLRDTSLTTDSTCVRSQIMLVSPTGKLVCMQNAGELLTSNIPKGIFPSLANLYMKPAFWVPSNNCYKIRLVKHLVNYPPKLVLVQLSKCEYTLFTTDTLQFLRQISCQLPSCLAYFVPYSRTNNHPISIDSPIDMPEIILSLSVFSWWSRPP